MARACSDDFTLERTSNQSYIAKHVKQFVARRLIVAGERNVVDISEFIDILVGHTHEIGQTVELILFHRAVVDYDGIVEVTTLYKVVLDKRLNLAHEHKCAACGNLLGKFGKVVKCGILIVEHRRVKINHRINREVIVGQYNK